MPGAIRMMIGEVGAAPVGDIGAVQFSNSGQDQFSGVEVDTDGTVYAVGKVGDDAILVKLDSDLELLDTFFVQGDTTTDNNIVDVAIGSDLYVFAQLKNSTTTYDTLSVFRLQKSDLSVSSSISVNQISDATVYRGHVRSDGNVAVMVKRISDVNYIKFNAALTSILNEYSITNGQTLTSGPDCVEVSATQSIAIANMSNAVIRLNLFNTDTGAMITDSRSYRSGGNNYQEWVGLAVGGSYLYAVGPTDDMNSPIRTAQVYRYSTALVPPVWARMYSGTDESSFVDVLYNANGLYCVGYTKDFAGTVKGALVVKIDPITGPTVLAEQVFTNGYDCEFLGVADDADGNIYCCGYLGTASQPKAVVMKLNKDLSYTSISPDCASGLVVTNSNLTLNTPPASINTQSIGNAAAAYSSGPVSYTETSPTITQEGPCAF